LVRCHSRKDLDRAHAAGMLGWMPLALHGELVTRMQPYQVQVFATSRKWESKRQQGRDFGE
ncbi:MAG: hypothetical protein ACYS29_11515, partial [Planctomycetota bacterium]